MIDPLVTLLQNMRFDLRGDSSPWEQAQWIRHNARLMQRALRWPCECPLPADSMTESLTWSSSCPAHGRKTPPGGGELCKSDRRRRTPRQDDSTHGDTIPNSVENEPHGSSALRAEPSS